MGLSMEYKSSLCCVCILEQDRRIWFGRKKQSKSKKFSIYIYLFVLFRLFNHSNNHVIFFFFFWAFEDSSWTS